MMGVVVAGLGIEPAIADDAPAVARIALRAGVESSSTVTLTADPGRREGALLVALDADTFYEPFVFGGSVGAAGAPSSYGALRASVHAGLHAPTTSVRATAIVDLGLQWLEHICPLFHDQPCGSATLPFTELRGELGTAGKHVELAIWGAIRVDLGRDHVTSGNEYDIGGVTFGGGLTLAYVSRR